MFWYSGSVFYNPRVASHDHEQSDTHSCFSSRSQLEDANTNLVEEIGQQQESIHDLRTQVDSANSQTEELQERIQTIIAERVRAVAAHSRGLDVG